MEVVIINCSIHHEMTDRTVKFLTQSLKSEPDLSIKSVGIDAFSELFSGNFINISNASIPQRKVLQTIIDSQALIFVCPTYYKTMPGSVKNFFDIVREKGLYQSKVVLAVSSNHKNQDFGARSLTTCIDAISEFYDIRLLRIPEIPIINPDSIHPHDSKRIVELLRSYSS